MRKNYDLSEEVILYLQEIKQKNSLNSETKALEKIVRDHKMRADGRDEEELKKIRLGVNRIDRSLQVIIEVLNSQLVSDDLKTIFPTDIIKNPILEEAEKIVKDRIAHQKQKKDNRK